MIRIKELRAETGMKQAELASRLSIGQTAVSNYEQEIRDPSVDTIRRLCKIFHVSADYLLGISSRRAPDLSAEDAELLAAYHAAPEEIRAIVDSALDRYKEKANAAAG